MWNIWSPRKILVFRSRWTYARWCNLFESHNIHSYWRLFALLEWMTFEVKNLSRRLPLSSIRIITVIKILGFQVMLNSRSSNRCTSASYNCKKSRLSRSLILELLKIQHLINGSFHLQQRFPKQVQNFLWHVQSKLDTFSFSWNFNRMCYIIDIVLFRSCF